MQSIQLKVHVGSDGILQIQMPSEVKDIDLDVVIVFSPSPTNEKVKTPDNLGWQSNFFEEVIGGWLGEPLVREEQGEYEKREKLF